MFCVLTIYLLFTRWMTASVILDFNTVATADKFGNVSVVGLILVCVCGWGYILYAHRYDCRKIHRMRSTKTRLEHGQFGIAVG